MNKKRGRPVTIINPIRFSVFISGEYSNKIKEIQKFQDITRTEIVRKGIGLYLEQFQQAIKIIGGKEE